MDHEEDALGGEPSLTGGGPVTREDCADNRLQHAAVGLLAAALLILGLYTLHNFLSALAWAGIWAIALWPIYRRAQARCPWDRHQVAVPLAFTLAVALVFVAPLSITGLKLAHEAREAASWLQSAQKIGIPEPAAFLRLPAGQAQVDGWWAENLADPEGARELIHKAAGDHAADIGRVVGIQVAHRLASFLFTLLCLFFLLREADTVTRQMRRAAARAFGCRGERIGVQIVASVHGTVNGLVLVGFGEGILLGFFYAFAGVPNPTLFGAVTAVAAMIPFGALVVFLIAALTLASKGALAWGVATFCVGMAVTFAADHVVRPSLIGGATRLPFLWVLLGILGGVETWGLVGLFLGPAVMAALMMLWREWSGDTSLTAPSQR
jgi:predicted PurR-regulated permease PerM